MKTRYRMILVFVIFLAIGSGCIPSLTTTGSIAISQKDTASWMNAIYNAQYADYLTWFVKDAQGKDVLKPNTPEAQRQVLIKKKAIFTELHPLLITYSEYVKTGVAPSGTVIATVEARAVQLVNDLIAEGGK